MHNWQYVIPAYVVKSNFQSIVITQTNSSDSLLSQHWDCCKAIISSICAGPARPTLSLMPSSQANVYKKMSAFKHQLLMAHQTKQFWTTFFFQFKQSKLSPIINHKLSVSEFGSTSFFLVWKSDRWSLSKEKKAGNFSSHALSPLSLLVAFIVVKLLSKI